MSSTLCGSSTTAPTVALSTAAGSAGTLLGVYSYAYTWVTIFGETEASPSAGIVLASNQALLTLPITDDLNVVSRNIYRTTAGGSALLLVATVPAKQSLYADNMPDSQLGVAPPTLNTALSLNVAHGRVRMSMPVCESRITVVADPAGSQIPDNVRYVFVVGQGQVTLPYSCAQYAGSLITLVNNLLSNLTVNAPGTQLINSLLSQITLIAQESTTFMMDSNTNWIQMPSGFDPTQQLHIFNTTPCTSSTTGALIVDGGVGIGQSVQIASNLSIGSNVWVGSTITANQSISAGHIITANEEIISPTATISSSVNTPTLNATQVNSQNVVANSTTNATNLTSGSIVASGGIAAAMDVRAGGVLYATNAGLGLYNIPSGTASYTLPATGSRYIMCNTTGGSQTVNLPPVSATPAGMAFVVKRRGANSVIVAANGSDTIDGASSVTINNAYGYLSIVSDGAEWNVTGSA